MRVIIKCPHCKMDIDLTKILVYAIPTNTWISKRCSQCNMNIDYLLDVTKED